MDLMYTRHELEKLASQMYNEIAGRPRTVSRFTHGGYDSVRYRAGKSQVFCNTQSNFNLEDMHLGMYSQTGVHFPVSLDYEKLIVARDIMTKRFRFSLKSVALPDDERCLWIESPEKINYFDREMRAFTESHPDTSIRRSLEVQQRVIVNSGGGVVIQSTPFFEIMYEHGLKPIPTHRSVNAVVRHNLDIRNFTDLIKYMADPTPDKKIKSASNFTDAFHELFSLSNLRMATIHGQEPIRSRYDVVVLTGTAAHEIFGHHFEEPIRFLHFGDSATFKFGQIVENEDLMLVDDPTFEIEGYNVWSFSPFDAYGRERKPVVNIDKGRVVGFLGGEYVDQDGLESFVNMKKSESVGCSAQYLDGSFPQPRMTCTVIDGKTEDVDLEGKLVVVPSKGRTDSSDKTYNVQASECYIIKGGVPLRIIPLQLSGGINDAIAEMVLLDDETYNTGLCQVDDPISGGGSKVPVAQFAKSQLWQKVQVYPLPLRDRHVQILTK